MSHNPCCVAVQCSQHIRIHVSDPLFPFLCVAKVVQGTLDVRAHNAPVKLCVAVTQVSGRLIPQLLIEADLLELIEEGRASQQAIGVSELADQVRSADQCWISLWSRIKIIKQLEFDTIMLFPSRRLCALA